MSHHASKGRPEKRVEGFDMDEAGRLEVPLASRSKWRKKVLPLYTKGMKERRLEKRLLRLSKKKERGNTDVYRSSWVYLLGRSFGSEGFECPRCCGVMELRMGQVFGVMA